MLVTSVEERGKGTWATLQSGSSGWIGMLDLLIRDGQVVDGSGADPVRANVGVRDGRIVTINQDPEDSDRARRIIDAEGLTIAPGFVDVHTHYDAQVFWDPACTPSSFHGVTTLFCGNCGFSVAPLGEDPTYIMRMLAEVEGIPLEALEAGAPWNWKSFGEYLESVESARPSVNIGVSAGHSALRRLVLGSRSHDNDVAPGDIAAMQTLLAESLSSGAMGFSTSWGTFHFDGDGNPVPSRCARSDELIALSGALRAFPGAQLEFIPTNDDFEQVHLETMTEMARAAATTLNWNILVPRSAECVANRMSASEHAAARGATVVGLSYPDVMATHACLLSPGFSTIPGWEQVMALSRRDRLRAVRNPETRALLRRAAETTPQGRLRRFDAMTVSKTYHPDNRALVGRRLGDIAASRGTSPLDVMFDIAVADDLRTLFATEPRASDEQAWEARIATWTDPRVIVGASDGGAHVHTLSTFDYPVRFIARQRELGVLRMGEAIRKLTDVPARLYGAKDRGRVQPGYWADMVIFDADSIGPGDPEWRDDLPAGAGRVYSEPRGIRSVIVNGSHIVEEGRLTGSSPGQVLRRSAE